MSPQATRQNLVETKITLSPDTIHQFTAPRPWTMSPPAMVSVRIHASYDKYKCSSEMVCFMPCARNQETEYTCMYDYIADQ